MLNHTIKNIPPSGIRKYFDLAASIPGMISLGVGEPDFDTPWHIREEAIYAIERGNTFYTSNQGLAELRREIANYLKRRFALDYDWNTQIMVTVGGSEALDIAFRSILNPGDEVIVLNPSYIAYVPAIQMAGGIPVIIDLEEKTQFKLTKEKLEAAITPHSKALLLNYPSNPTGGIMNKEDYEALVPLIHKHELIVLSDEIYAELNYANEHISIASFDLIKDQVILINGFSKAYAMTGWRLGYLACHPLFLEAMNKVHQYVIMCPSTISQYAGIKALRDGDDDVIRMRQSFEMRRNYIVNRLHQMGLTCHLPQGAFYVFPNIAKTGLTSEQFVEQLIQTSKVAVVPGTAFGASGEGYIRISYAYSLEEIKEAMNRMELFLAQLEGARE